jgi:hypothetical protein
MKSYLREAYERTAKIFPDFIISRQEFRMEAPLANNQSQYALQLKQGNQSTDGPSQVLLNDSDAFVLCGISIGIVKHDLSVSPALYGTYQVFTYPDGQIFVGVPPAGATEQQSLLSIYNGTIEFRTESLIRKKPSSTVSYLYAPQAQVIDGSPTAGVLTLAQFGGFTEDSRGYVEEQPTPLISGQQSNIFTVTLGAGDYTAIAGQFDAEGESADSRNYLVVRLLGMLVANGSQAALRFAKNWGGE